jgi:opacity protein-like surface antigen
MKKYSILASLLLGFVTGSVQAGGEVYKQVAPPPPPPVYGTGFYGAIDAGANVYQNLPGSRTFTADFDDVAIDLKYSPNHEVGFFGGIKLGYVFGTGVIRPTVEGDFFYNGFKPGANFTLDARDAFGQERIASASASTWLNTGAFMANFILRFAPGNQRFQPYVGAGVGGYVAQSEGVNGQVSITGVGRGNFHLSREFLRENVGTAEFSDLAWQVVAGADYYWTPKISTFIEYHYLDYTTATLIAVRDTETRQRIQAAKQAFNTNGDLGQHLVGLGVRFHF